MCRLKNITKTKLYELRDKLLLTDRQKLIFIYVFENDLCLDEIAEKLLVSYSTVAHESSLIRKKIDKFNKTD